jgi:methyl-accepting chemotaxis protein
VSRIASAPFVRDSRECLLQVGDVLSVPKPDGSGRAIGTILDPAGKAIAEIKQGKPFYGEVTILGTPYITGYEPMKDAGGNVIGIYYVGYKK